MIVRINIPITALPAVWKAGRDWLMPKPLFLRECEAAGWAVDPAATQLVVSIGIEAGWLWGQDMIPNARLYFIRKDFGPPGEPEGIWLKWIADGTVVHPLETNMLAGKDYKAVVAVRHPEEGIAYIANETFIESGGRERKWPLPPGRGPMIADPDGRYTFWLEVRSGKKRWRSEHFYALWVPPAGVRGERFTLKAVDP
jgi:hypothetical protein